MTSDSDVPFRRMKWTFLKDLLKTCKLMSEMVQDFLKLYPRKSDKGQQKSICKQ